MNRIALDVLIVGSVLGTAPPCAAALPTPEPLVPVLPDQWWLALVEAREAGAALLDSTLARTAWWLLPTSFLAWRYGPTHQALLTAAAAGAPIVLGAPHIVGAAAKGHPPVMPMAQQAPLSSACPDNAAGPRAAHFQTIVGGFPASGVMTGVPPLPGPGAGSGAGPVRASRMQRVPSSRP